MWLTPSRRSRTRTNTRARHTLLESHSTPPPTHVLLHAPSQPTPAQLPQLGHGITTEISYCLARTTSLAFGRCWPARPALRIFTRSVPYWRIPKGHLLCRLTKELFCRHGPAKQAYLFCTRIVGRVVWETESPARFADDCLNIVAGPYNRVLLPVQRNAGLFLCRISTFCQIFESPLLFERALVDWSV